MDGIPIVRPELLALQLFDACRYERAERLTERMWSDRLTSGPALRRFLDQMGARGRNGSAGLRRYLDARPDDYVPPASGLEGRAMQLLRAAELEFRRQVDVGDDQWCGRVDFLHVSLALVLEIQSERHHTALVDVSADAARRARLEAAGFTVLELTDVLVWSDPAEFVRRVRAAIDSCRQSRA
jgi:very-short-patch-repair endonuclease